jgi:hypothetical protein
MRRCTYLTVKERKTRKKDSTYKERFFAQNWVIREANFRFL